MFFLPKLFYKNPGVRISNNVKSEKQVVAASQQAMVEMDVSTFKQYDKDNFNIVYATCNTLNNVHKLCPVTMLKKCSYLRKCRVDHQTGDSMFRMIIMKTD